MGTGIAIVASAVANLEVKVIDTEEKRLSSSRKFTEDWCSKEIAKNRMTSEERFKVLERFSYFLTLDQLHDCDLVVEAVVENYNVKAKIFADLSRITKPETILASNTSSISITKLASATTRPDKVIGMHFMNPVPVMKLIEVIRGLGTSKQTLETVLEYQSIIKLALQHE
jgi:3-hydroxybutyryl-CoA dehydrogenase